MAAPDRPNILIVITDQQRADSLSCYGNPVIKTPNIDAFAATSTRFADAHCAHPLCMPARGTLLTGRWPSVNGQWRNGVPLSGTEHTFADYLSAAGYSTSLVGKAHFTPYYGDPDEHPESVHLDVRPEEEVWAYWDAFGDYYGFEDSQISISHGPHTTGAGHYGMWLHEKHSEKLDWFDREHALASSDSSIPSWKSRVPPEIHSTRWVTDLVLDRLRSDSESPFCIMASYPDPHFPFNPPAPYHNLFDSDEIPEPENSDGSEWDWPLPDYVRYYLEEHPITDDPQQTKQIISHYYGMVAHLDDQIGRLFAELRSLNLEDETLVVFSSDHGEWLGDHGMWNKGPIHTRGITQVPLMIRWPGVSRAGTTVDAVTSHIDIAPTIVDAAKIEVPYGMQGNSLREVVAGEAEPQSPVLVEHRQERSRERTAFEDASDERGIEHGRPWGHEDLVVKTLLTDHFRYSHVTGIEMEYGELFNRSADPGECDNRWWAEPTLRSQLQERLLKALMKSDDPLPERRYFA